MNGQIHIYHAVDLMGVSAPEGMMATHPTVGVCGAASALYNIGTGISYLISVVQSYMTWYVGATILMSLMLIGYYLYHTWNWRRLQRRANFVFARCGKNFESEVVGDVQHGCLHCAGVGEVTRDQFEEDYRDDIISVRCFANNCDDCYWAGKPLWISVNMDGKWFYTAYSQIRAAVNKCKDTVMTNIKFSKSNRVTSLNLSTLGGGFLQAKLQYAWLAITAMSTDKHLCYVEKSASADKKQAIGEQKQLDKKLLKGVQLKDWQTEQLPVKIIMLDEKQRANVIHVKEGTQIIGYITEGSTIKLRKDVTHEMKDFDQCDLNQIRTDAFIQEYHGIREGVGVNEATEYLFNSKKPAQAIIIGPYCKDSYIASKHSNCLTDALAGRHYTDDGSKMNTISRRHQKLLLKYTKKLLNYVVEVTKNRSKLLQEHEDKDGKPVSPQAFNFHNGDVEPMDMCAKSWSLLRKKNAAEFIAHIERDLMGKAKKEQKNRLQQEITQLKASLEIDQPESSRFQAFRRNVFVKLNEVLGKIKPRMIVSGGDEACMSHCLDSYTSEALIFACSFFESRSVKHADPEGLRDRFADRLKDFQFAMSNDYGRFDSTLGVQIRELVENTFIRGLLAELELHTENKALREALSDRLKGSLVLNAPFWQAIVGNPGRESGDRGTSVLNYLTGIVVFCVMIHLEIVDRCNKQRGTMMWSNAPVGDEEDYAENILDMWLRGDSTGFDFFGEGDDNLPMFTSQFIGSVDGYSKNITDRFVQFAKELNLILEPQDVNGKAPAGEGLYPVWGVKGRVEFTSKLIKIYSPDKGVFKALLVPKIDKFLKSISISFATQGDVQVIAMTKILSLMQNVLDVPLMYRYAAILYRYHFLKFKFRHGKIADQLTEKMLVDTLGSFDAARLTQDFDGKRYAQAKTFSAMYDDMSEKHTDIIVRGGENMHSAVAAAVCMECPELTPDKQWESLDALEALYDQMEHDFRKIYSCALRKKGYGRSVVWEDLDPLVDEYYAYLCAELNVLFRGYFCDIFWGSEPPAATLAGA